MNDAITQKPRMKVCNKCKTPKPATPDFYRKTPNLKCGLRGECKDCENSYYKDRYHNGGKDDQHKIRHRKSPHRTAFSQVRRRVRRQGRCKFLLGEARTPEAEAYIKYLQTITHCPDCSKEMVWYSEGCNNLDSASFDRIDSDADYTKKNVRIVCVHCNKQKQDSPVDEWVGLLEVRVRKGIIEEVDPRLTEYVRRQDTLDGFFDNERSVKEEA